MHVICDIDETIADNSHRHHLAPSSENGIRDWAQFLNPELVAKDAPIPAAFRALRYFTEIGSRISFLTGRNEGLRGVTEDWIVKHTQEFLPGFALYMRPNGELSRATDFKPRVLRQLQAERGAAEQWVCIDDDRYMWPVYRQFGALVLRAPQCWDVLFPEEANLPAEALWRK